MKSPADDVANTQSDVDESTVYNEGEVTITSTPGEKVESSEEKEKPVTCASRLIKFYKAIFFELCKLLSKFQLKFFYVFINSNKMPEFIKFSFKTQHAHYCIINIAGINI